MDSERIILGSGKLYCMVFTGEIPADTAIETDANQLAHIKGGASLEYTAETYTAKDDLGVVQKTILIDYLNITIFDVQEMPIDLYLYFMREANIHRLMQTKDGREYLDNCWRMEQTKPDRKKLREKMRKGER